LNKVHENTVLKLASLIFLGEFNDVIELGELLLKEVGENTDGGFWIWDLSNPEMEYYSPKVRKSLGFKSKKDFPNLAESWQKIIDPKDKEIAFKNLEENIKGEGSYYQVVKYNLKNGEVINLLCSGSLMKNEAGKPLYLFGTHKINF